MRGFFNSFLLYSSLLDRAVQNEQICLAPRNEASLIAELREFNPLQTLHVVKHTLNLLLDIVNLLIELKILHHPLLSLPPNRASIFIHRRNDFAHLPIVRNFRIKQLNKQLIVAFSKKVFQEQSVFDRLNITRTTRLISPIVFLVVNNFRVANCSQLALANVFDLPALQTLYLLLDLLKLINSLHQLFDLHLLILYLFV